MYISGTGMAHTVVCVAAVSVSFCSRPAISEWPAYARDNARTKLSPLAAINRHNVDKLVVAWRWPHGDQPLLQFGTYPGPFENTPIMIDVRLYVTTPYNRVVALDALTGKQLRSFDPQAYRTGAPPTGMGFVHRGVAVWRNGRSSRIFLNTSARLLALDPSGTPIKDFGSFSEIDLTAHLHRRVNRAHLTQTSPPLVYRNLVIVGSGVPDAIDPREAPPGIVQAFDVITGGLMWTFSPIPRSADDLGAATWNHESWRTAGHTNVWAPMTIDEDRALLYIPVSSPSNEYDGRSRHGQNLFANSLVCLDALTGRYIWHFQTVHHTLWDYDLASAPNLVTIRTGSRIIDAVAQASKTGFLYVFDRATGEPIWPIVETEVPTATDVPGEQPWATQPIPQRPPPFTRQGFRPEEFMPTGKSGSSPSEVSLLSRYFTFGPIFTPPTFRGTLQRPGQQGGANWGGAAVNPNTGTIYVKSASATSLARVGRMAETIPNEVKRALTVWQERPFYSLSSIDLNLGTVAWHRDLTPPQNQSTRIRPGTPAGPLATAGDLIFVGGYESSLHILDAASGEVLRIIDTGQDVWGSPMTYSVEGTQFVVLAVGGGHEGELIALRLDK